MTIARGRAAAVVRAWVWLYTAPVSLQKREARRREIASDLWEEQQAAPAGPASVSLLRRWALGIPSDLSWCAANARLGSRTTGAAAGLRQQAGAAGRVFVRHGVARSGTALAWLYIAIAVLALTANLAAPERPHDTGIGGAVFLIVSGALSLQALRMSRQRPRWSLLLVVLGLVPTALVALHSVVIPLLAAAAFTYAAAGVLRPRREDPRWSTRHPAAGPAGRDEVAQPDRHP